MRDTMFAEGWCAGVLDRGDEPYGVGIMEQHLSAFLASVRRTRFVDYLDPLGETAQNAFERRLSWARVSQHDPAYADEARFLLDHAEFLREVLRRELEEDDWIEEADVGREWETRPSRSVRMRENERVTEIFQADDLEVTRAPQNAHQARSSSRSSARGAPPRTASRSRDDRQAPARRSASSRAPSRSVAVSSPTPSPQPRGGQSSGARLRDGRIRSTPDPGERSPRGRSNAPSARRDVKPSQPPRRPRERSSGVRCQDKIHRLRGPRVWQGRAVRAAKAVDFVLTPYPA